MCSRATAGILLVFAATVVAAQDVREHERRVDSLGAVARVAQARLKAYDDSVARTYARYDTVRIEAMRLIVDPALRGVAETSARAAYPQLVALAGAGINRLDRYSFVVRRLHERTDSLVLEVRRTGSYGEANKFQLWGATDTTLLTIWMRHDALRALSESLDPEFQRWMFAELLPDTASSQSWLLLRLDLVSSETSVGRRCYDGDLKACKVALGLTPVSDRATEWFDAAGRQRLVSGSERRIADKDEARLCLAGQDSACVAIVRRMYARPVYPDSPISPGHRAALTRLAMQLGGSRGYERLLLATGSPSDRLAVAADLPIDSLLSAWRNKVRDTRMPSQDMSFPIAVGSLAWIAFCGALAFRSSRWR